MRSKGSPALFGKAIDCWLTLHHHKLYTAKRIACFTWRHLASLRWVQGGQRLSAAQPASACGAPASRGTACWQQPESVPLHSCSRQRRRRQSAQGRQGAAQFSRGCVQQRSCGQGEATRAAAARFLGPALWAGAPGAGVRGWPRWSLRLQRHIGGPTAGVSHRRSLASAACGGGRRWGGGAGRAVPLPLLAAPSSTSTSGCTCSCQSSHRKRPHCGFEQGAASNHHHQQQQQRWSQQQQWWSQQQQWRSQQQPPGAR